MGEKKLFHFVFFTHQGTLTSRDFFSTLVSGLLVRPSAYFFRLPFWNPNQTEIEETESRIEERETWRILHVLRLFPVVYMRISRMATSDKMTNPTKREMNEFRGGWYVGWDVVGA